MVGRPRVRLCRLLTFTALLLLLINCGSWFTGLQNVAQDNLSKAANKESVPIQGSFSTKSETSSIFTQEASSSIFTQEANSSIFTQEASSSIFTQEASSSILTQEASSSILTQEASSSILTQEASSSIFTQEASSSIFTQEANSSIFTQEASSSIFTQEADFRVIVITFNRPQSLRKLLATIDNIELDGDEGCLEIWIDRNKQNEIDNETVEVANSFRWKQGPTKVYIQKEHAGIYGQWIETWKPQSDDTKEIALILEDDLSVSKYVYRWLKAVHRFYGPSKDFAGATLQTDEVFSHDSSHSHIKAQKNETVFMYKCIGTWGFSPKASVWRSFEDWFSIHIKQPDFHPYVPGIAPTEWYKKSEKTGTADSMWEMWFIYFAYQEKLFTLYSNLNEYNNDGTSCLSINRREVGLHYHSKGREDYCKLLNTWRPDFINFSTNITKLDWTGEAIQEY